MSLYFVFTVDGDWDEYFLFKLSKAERAPDKKTLLDLIKRECKIARIIDGKLLHFVHTSPAFGDFFLQPEFISIWKKIKELGGSVGIHCHYEDLYRGGSLYKPEKVGKAIDFLTGALRNEALGPISYRGGYLTFCKKNIPLLEKNKLFLDFSCDPDRYLMYNGQLVADWRGAPDNYYRLSYEDHRKVGESDVVEIPLGKNGKDALYIDITSLATIWKTARALAKKSRERSGNIIVSVLTHTYEFSSFWKRQKIRLTLFICKRYGTFINDGEALQFINTAKKGKNI